jgi:integrase/recombinase XerD
MAIDKLLEFLHQMGMSAAPTPTNHRIKPDKEQRIKNIQPLTQQEIKTLQANIINTYSNLSFIQQERKHEQLKLIFALYYGCGLRRTEGFKLTVNDIDFDKKTIFIKQGKNYKDSIIPMNTSVCKALEHYIYNFRNLQKVNHKRLFIQSVGKVADSLQELQNVCGDEAIQSKRLTLHILRHSIATHLLQNGMSIESIARFLGHTSLESTQIYTHLV